MKIQNYNITVAINNITLLGDTGGLGISELTITENIQTVLPTCKLIFVADHFFLNDSPLVDGSIINIEISDDKKTVNEKLVFRLYDLSINNNNGFLEYTIFGYLDLYTMFEHPYQYTLIGNSSDVFKNVAKSLKLDSEIDVTKDKQLWVASELSLIKWLSNVCEYGWVNDKSCMSWGITRNKKLLYKDISNRIRSIVTKNCYNLYPVTANDTVIESSSNIIPYQASIPTFCAGYENLCKTGYGGDNYFFDFGKYSNQTVAAKKAIATSNVINVNKNLAKGLIDNFFPFNVGNMHDNYYLAKLQNNRIASLFSTYFTVVLTQWYPLQLLDYINFYYISNVQSDVLIKSLNGLYLITGLSTCITPTTFNTVLMIAGQGYNTSKSTETY